ncbi:MAG TPA: hypothetical protein VFT44_04595 [Pyrinomonadaceae bacterium]|nr:hypothetical protein [Pyrinomonadaceae bacterium]
MGDAPFLDRIELQVGPNLWADLEQSLCLQINGISEFRRIEDYQVRSVSVAMAKSLFDISQINFDS